jgi:putative ubiquitin-RnfH superfamily antitoxin RatB of RatAB toxin-antitoxin module
VSRRALRVEVVYALAERQTLLHVQIREGDSVADALAASEIYELHPETRDPATPVGIFGKAVPLSHRPADGDRIELYRPLLADPKAVRNARVAKKRLARENFRNMRA